MEITAGACRRNSCRQKRWFSAWPASMTLAMRWANVWPTSRTETATDATGVSGGHESNQPRKRIITSYINGHGLLESRRFFVAGYHHFIINQNVFLSNKRTCFTIAVNLEIILHKFRLSWLKCICFCPCLFSIVYIYPVFLMLYSFLI